MTRHTEKAHNEDVMAETTGQRLARLIQQNGVTYDQVKEGLAARGVQVRSRQTITNWTRRKELPRDVLVALAQYFRDEHGEMVTWEWLRDGERAAIPSAYDDELMLKILDGLDQVSDEEGVTLTNRDVSHIVCILHPLFYSKGHYDHAILRQMVRLSGRK